MADRSFPLLRKDLAHLSHVVDHHLRARHVYKDIRDIVSNYCVSRASVPGSANRTWSVECLGSGSPPNQPVDESTSPKRHLIVKILPGRAFVGNLVQDELLDGQQSASTLQAFLHMGSTRVASKEVLATVEPPFNESCAFLLQDRLDTSLRELVHSTLTLQLAIVHTDPVGAKTLTGSQRCEWRQVLETGAHRLTVELTGDMGPHLVTGVIVLELELSPLPEVDQLVPRGTIERVVQEEHQIRRKLASDFRSYAKAWWRQLQAVRPFTKRKTLKMFGHAENGDRRFLCTFVRPVSPGRILPTVLHAARMVALLGGTCSNYEIDPEGIWHDIHTIVCLKAPHSQDRALLLCSLLLGFGLDAFVCIGTMQRDLGTPVNSAWVMTRNTKNDVIFWDPVSGARYDVKKLAAVALDAYCAEHGCSTPEDPFTASFAHAVVTFAATCNVGKTRSWAEFFPFASIVSVFSHTSFHTNIQAHDVALLSTFDVTNSTQWATFPTKLVGALESQPALELEACRFPVALGPRSTGTILVADCSGRRATEDTVEQTLCFMIENYRKTSCQVDTSWNSALSQAMGPALVAFEERLVSGTDYGEEHFRQAIAHTVPSHANFHALPFHFSQLMYAQDLFRAMLQKTELRAMLETLESSFALRVHISTYAEDVVSMWCMVGAITVAAAAAATPCEVAELDIAELKVPETRKAPPPLPSRRSKRRNETAVAKLLPRHLRPQHF